MKKSLFVWNGTASKQFSGGDNYVIKFIKFANLNFDVLLPKGNEPAIQNKNSVFLTTSNFQAKAFLSIVFLYVLRLCQAIKIILSGKSEYQFAFTASPFLFDILPPIFAKAEKKVVILYHVIPKRKAKNISTLIRFFLADIEKNISFFFIKKYFDVIITGNKIEQEKLKHIFPDKKIIIAHAGIDTNLIDSYPAKKKDTDLISFMGRLTSQKGIFDLVEIMGSLSKKYPRLKLVIIGDGPDRKELEQRIKKAKLTSVKLKGFVTEEEKYKILKSSKYFFFPSYEEGWGIALAEALYAENICFCYELPHYKSIFSNFPVYIKKGDSKDFADKFKEYPKLRLNKKQKEFIKKYDDKRVINEVINKLQ